jgi:ABC-type cobalamin/Fe3+-siderophores transport system ATPase subunit
MFFSQREETDLRPVRGNVKKAQDSFNKQDIVISILGSEKCGKSTLLKSQLFTARLDGAEFQHFEGRNLVKINQKNFKNLSFTPFLI